ncbi:MAG TPA: 5-oxoprolinase subunit PxpB [Candidatus Polarisedimenticolaceae bacterium]
MSVPLLDWASDRALRVRFADTISDAAHDDVRRALAAFERAPVPGQVNLHPAHASILVVVDPLAATAEAVEAAVRATLHAADDLELPEPRLVEIPVCYEPPYALDLDDVARRAGISIDEVVRAHAGALYRVDFLGFAPGFPYLSGLPERLATPRRTEPRIRIPAGSVAIAGSQAGIYPVEIPGGWNVIGRTPRVLFPPPLLRVGDRVRFLPIPADAFR